LPTTGNDRSFGVRSTLQYYSLLGYLINSVFIT